MTEHEALMRHAMHMADTARLHARPNPWVGAVLICASGEMFEGATQAPGGAHAEIVAINNASQAGVSTVGATLYCTLEPCNHTGRTGPCTEAIIAAGITTVVVGIEDPDTNVSGAGLSRLSDAGIDVTIGVLEHDIREQLAPYIHHRLTGRPYVLLKMASTLDARTSRSGDERWITGAAARTRVHQLRAQSDAIVVGAGTVLADDPELTVRHIDGPSPKRVVLSRSTHIPDSARIHPCTVWAHDIESLLDELGAQGVLQLMVEGGPSVATAFHQRGLVDEYVFHVAPIASGDSSAPGVFSADAEFSFERLAFVSTAQYDDDIEIVYRSVSTHHELHRKNHYEQV